MVATQVCCGSLKAEPGRELLVADTPEEFASAVELLLDNHALRASLVQAGRKYVEKYHDWTGCVKVLCDAYAEAAADFLASQEVITSL
jgi:glycosyltransferase involved in cell wall biosynthesis